MLTMNFTEDTKSHLPLYRQLAEHFKKEIRLNHLVGGAKLPSIRKLAAALSLSRTTVETAYGLLSAEGYIISQPKRGYRAVSLAELPPAIHEIPQKQAPNQEILYNFANNYIDIRTFSAALWRRCLNNTLKEPQNIASYGQAQGEGKLREVLARYSYEARGVIATAEQIVIGAGVQSLLEILIGILQPEFSSVALESPGFPQAERIFKDHHWQVENYTVEKLHDQLPPLLLVSPSNPYKGSSLTAEERLSLLHWIKQTGGLIIEDDYNGEFRYFSRPVGALQGLAGGENIIYFGSFSRLLMPSLRISYMVLPPHLLSRYNACAHLYNQTSSTIEQLALAEFISGGHLRQHVRRLRKLYSLKNTLLREALTEIFGKRIEVRSYASGLHIRLVVRTQSTSTELTAKALDCGVQIIPVLQTNAQENPEILLSFAGINEDHIRPALLLLKKAWFG
ncbi:MAG: PLP-dependent aminotransferase family protein [Acidaminococcaceae bacterium]